MSTLPLPQLQPRRALLLALAGTLAGCSQQEAPAPKPATAATPAQAFEVIAATGKGFAVGALLSANPVYVLFDPQCPHCGRLWQAATPLLGKIKMVWVPVAIINPKSAPQGAALLAAANPMEMMSSHEASILAGTGGVGASASIPSEVEAAIKGNTNLFTRLGLESVPFIVGKNSRSGVVLAHSGALSTEKLAEFAGVTAP